MMSALVAILIKLVLTNVFIFLVWVLPLMLMLSTKK